MQKKILILGGAKAQVQLIKAAKDEGYYVVLCDFTDTNPGIEFCDKHYKINYMDFDSVLNVAEKEKVDGVISNSEYAMPAVSYVSDKMHCVGNTPRSLSLINDKYKFRELQKSLGLYSPNAVESATWEDCLEKVQQLSFPVVIKPSQSSGSRGTTKVESFEAFLSAQKEWEQCEHFSRNHRVVVEEYVKLPDLDAVIDGDIFVLGDTILYNGLFTSKRSKRRPLIPMMQTYPIILDENHLDRLKNGIEKIVRGAGITWGELNVEAYYTKDDELFFIEFNARQGRNGIPEMILKHSGIDYNKLLVTTSVDERDYFQDIINTQNSRRYVTRQQLFWTDDNNSCCYKGICFSKEIEPFIKGIKDVVPKNTIIQPAQNASDCLAWIDLEFESREQQIALTRDIEMQIWPEVELVK